MLAEHETITYTIPTRRKYTRNRTSKFDDMKVDVLHPRVFRPANGEDINRMAHNIAQSARAYGKKVGWKFRTHAVEHEGSMLVAVWRIA